MLFLKQNGIAQKGEHFLEWREFNSQLLVPDAEKQGTKLLPNIFFKDALYLLSTVVLSTAACLSPDSLSDVNY